MRAGEFEAPSIVTHRILSMGAADTRGKHRIQAEVKRLEQETRFLEVILISAMGQNDLLMQALYNLVQCPVHIIAVARLKESFREGDSTDLRTQEAIPCINGLKTQEELEQLEKLDKASAACKDMLKHVEATPDPLLPVTIGSVNPTWDRWFEGQKDSKGCSCSIL